jgi:hypothetical protein
MAEKKKGDRMIRLKVSANLLESQGVEKPKGVAYAFSAGGKLLDRESLDAKGTAVLSFPASEEPQSVRVLVGPEAGKEEIQVTELTRRGAAGRRIRVEPKELNPSLEIDVIPDHWRCWLLGLCFVRGRLLKRVEREGIPVDLPVCHATVEVYEVDPLFLVIPRLPEYVIEGIRDFIVREPFPPIPPEFPERIPEPFPPPPSPGPFPPGPGFRSRAAALPQAAAAALQAGAAATSADFQFLVKNATLPQLRQIFAKNVDLLRPILCALYPRFVTKQLVATATTDECGRFQTFFFKGCNNPDTPDLYFIAKQRLFGFFNLTIYEPTPVACHTFWDYSCGSEITLYTSHPLAMTCSPCPSVNAPNNWVLAMAVGNLPLSRIYGSSIPLQATTTPDNKGLTDGGAPFGGLLRLRLEFDNSLRETLGVKYYRVSYRKGTAGAFTPLSGSVVRHYTLEIGGDLVLKVYPLGPFVVGAQANLFEIPPALPPEGQWSFPDLLEDLTSAKFPTSDLAPAAEHGKYQLKVDLFDAAGTLLNIAAKGIVYRVPAVTDLSGDIDTDDAAGLGLVFDDDGDGKNSFIMTLHVDNNECTAAIAAPTLDGTPAGDDCGVLEYDPDSPGSVTMNYTASHPQGFATYRFVLYRGVNPLTPPTTSGPVGSGSFSTTQTVPYLLGSCRVAGYSENVDVWASATDGWSRLSRYDDHAVRAFVLAPQEEEP